jgi:antirestriction protein
MRIYVGTFKKYNAGSLKGEWLDLEDYKDKGEFLEACNKLHDDEDDPEFMFQDSEDIPSGMVSESHIDEECWELIEAYDEFDEDAVNAYCHLFDGWDKQDFQDRYRGHFASWEDMAEQLLEETGELESIPENLRFYFDYEKYANDLHIGGDFCEHDGYYFWRN